jgi:hypothetical protein
MRTCTLGLLNSFLVVAAASCQGDSDDRDDEQAAHTSPLSRLIPQVMPPIDIKAPPEDAMKTSSGLAVKRLTARDGGAQARRGDTVMVQYTGWRQRTGETFFTTKGSSQPLTLDVEHSAPAFSEALQLLRKGEKAVLWVPPSESTPEALVYEVEVIDVVPPPQVAKQPVAGDNSQSKATSTSDGATQVRSEAAPVRSNAARAHSDAGTGQRR